MVDTATFDDSGFPKEAFACPHCGQMLAASCRVCVACKASINPAEIREALVIPELGEPRTPRLQVAAPARFSWKLFFLIFGVVWLAAINGIEIWGPEKTQEYLGFLPMISAPWVILDAHRRHIAKPLRWAIGTLLIWPVLFPWYLARRQTPQAPCPFVEGIGLPIVIVAIILISIIIVLAAGPGAYKMG